MSARRASAPVKEVAASALTPDDHHELLRFLLLMRGLEERAMTLYRQGKVPGSFYDGRGQEAIPVGATFALSAADRLCPLHRDLGAHLVRGSDPARILGQYMGRKQGITAGRDANVHFGERALGCVGMVSMLGSMLTVCAGLALRFQLASEPRCALTWIGDGGTSTGAFHEALNFAGARKLPMVVIVENNAYAYSTPVAQQTPVEPVERAAAYGFAGERVDGNDVAAVFEATRAARELAIDGGGPTLIEAVTMRMHGHAAHDDMRYVPEDIVGSWAERDPIERQTARLRELGGDPDVLVAEVEAAIKSAAEEALAMSDPSLEDDWRDVYCNGEPEALASSAVERWSGFKDAA